MNNYICFTVSVCSVLGNHWKLFNDYDDYGFDGNIQKQSANDHILSIFVFFFVQVLFNNILVLVSVLSSRQTA